MEVYTTREIEKGAHITEIFNELNLDNKKFFKHRLRIKEVNYDENESALEFSLKGKDFSGSYTIIDCGIINSFFKDMQVLEDLELEDRIKALIGRTLDGIFNIENGWFGGLSPSLYKWEMSPYLSEIIKQKVGRGVNEYIILKRNKKLTDEDYAFTNELKKLGLLNIIEEK